jgi:hypothetical protein
MQESSPPMRAAIDIGSNTIHIVVARCRPDTLDIIEDQVDIVRIGESVTATGEISPQKRDATLAILRKYKALADQHQASPIFVVATEAIRQANNSAAFLEDVKRETGLEVHLISGTAEATLTFYGATYELNAEPNAPSEIGVVDLGGGSMELVTAKNMHITWRTSIPIGSGWLHDRYLPSNPPAHDELDAARIFLQTYFQGMRLKHRPPALIGTGGSANSLLHLAHRAFKLEMDISSLTYADLILCEGLMTALPAEEVSQRYDQPLDRARILLAGALIIQEVMSSLGLDEIRISPHGIREGVLLAYERFGGHWLENAEENATSDTSRRSQLIAPTTDLSATLKANIQGESFVQSGQRILLDRTKKFLEWPREVLKHEDIEAVHKMRVASRRLRAALDAYQSCCDPKLFKKVYRQVKQAADVLGAARDTDVMLQNLQAQLAQTPTEQKAGVQWLINRLETYRQQKRQDLDAFLHELDEEKFKQQVRSCISEGAAFNGQS